MDQQFHLLDEAPKDRGLSIGAVASFALHAAVVGALALAYAEPQRPAEPPVRYVELMSAMPQQPAERQFVEAPGPEINRTPSADAAYSDANRRASMPSPTGDQPTKRPGLDAPFTPGRPAPPQPAAQAPRRAASAKASGGGDPSGRDANVPEFAYRVPTGDADAPSKGDSDVDWRNAIREVGKVASLGGEGGFPGGEAGFAESGPISFETQWYDWGEYAQHMVARIRTNWHANMPNLIRMGVRGVVTLRFTIQRDGRITDVEMIKSSGHPPYDFAARKAIESSSALRPLPADFPNPSERVTAAFYYNMRPDRK
ncbi:MAG: energy transducer TonB [Thermoanaerobaculia bacterium]